MGIKIKCNIDPETLLSELEKLYQQKSYIFRGQPSSTFHLIPNAFRVDGIHQLAQKFPATSKYQEWYFSDEMKKLIKLHAGTERIIYDIPATRLGELTFYTLQYNYSLAHFVQQYPEKFDSKSREMYAVRPASFWQEKETFIYLFQYSLSLALEITALDGKILQQGKIEEELAGYDDGLPQHYDIPTAALDWTRNPYNAIYFALQKSPNLVSSHFSIYAYREISPSEHNPLEVQFGHPESKNPRIIAQDGLFTRVKRACRYYYLHGRWPSVERIFTTYPFLNNESFELIKYNVPIEHAVSLENLLKEKNINKFSLFPDKN